MAKASIELSAQISEMRSLRLTTRGGPAFAGVPLLASGTIFKNSAQVADFLFLNKCLFSPILEVFIMMILKELSDFFYLFTFKVFIYNLFTNRIIIYKIL